MVADLESLQLAYDALLADHTRHEEEARIAIESLSEDNK